MQSPRHATLSHELLAGRIRRSSNATARLLRELEAAGMVVQDGDGWRLSPQAQACFGEAFRRLPLADGVEANDVARRLPAALR